MKIELDVPTWYSRESMYASKVKSTDIFLDSACVDLSKADVNLHPTEEDLQTILPSVSVLLAKETESWFSSPLTADQVQKRLKCQFSPVPCDTEERWVKATWTPSYFQVLKKGFVLIFNLFKITSCNPRIPLTFFEAMTPRAGSPTDEGSVEVRNIVLQPGAGPRDLEDIDDIPLSENLTSFEIRDDQARERHKFRQAKLRAAIARLKVEEMRERYLRHYGTEYLEESSDSEDEDSSQGSELSEPVHKK